MCNPTAFYGKRITQSSSYFWFPYFCFLAFVYEYLQFANFGLDELVEILSQPNFNELEVVDLSVTCFFLFTNHNTISAKIRKIEKQVEHRMW